jgi:hypothetical protein
MIIKKNSVIGKSGYLLKKGEINKSWRLRWFVLQDDKLFYFKTSEQSKPIGFIPLDQTVVRKTTMESEVKEFCFEIITKNRIFQLAAKSKNDMMEWIKVLNTHTILHTENELIHQAEEMILKVTRDRHVSEDNSDDDKLLKKLLENDKNFILDENNNNNNNNNNKLFEEDSEDESFVIRNFPNK